MIPYHPYYITYIFDNKYIAVPATNGTIPLSSTLSKPTFNERFSMTMALKAPTNANNGLMKKEPAIKAAIIPATVPKIPFLLKLLGFVLLVNPIKCETESPKVKITIAAKAISLFELKSFKVSKEPATKNNNPFPGNFLLYSGLSNLFII